MNTVSSSHNNDSNISAKKIECFFVKAKTAENVQTKREKKVSNEINKKIIRMNPPESSINNLKICKSKNIIIKNFKERPKADVSIDTLLQKLESAVEAIFNRLPVSYSLEDLYQAVAIINTQNKSSILYERLSSLFNDHMSSLASSFLDKFIETLDNYNCWLKKVKEFWEIHCRQTIMIRSIFIHLDRFYILKTSSTLSIWDLGLKLFRNHILENSKIQNFLISGMIGLINSERNATKVDRSLLKNLVAMLTSLQMYESFEEPFIEETNKFYNLEGQTLQNDLQVNEYLDHVEKRLKEESDRVVQYLNIETKRFLLSCIEKNLIEVHIENILTKGLESLLVKCDKMYLSLLFRLFSRVSSGLTTLCHSFTSFIKTHGCDIVTNLENDNSMVQLLLDFKSKLDSIVEESFQSNSHFIQALKESFELVINKRPNKPAEMMAKYIDLKLRSGNKEFSEEELENTLDKIMIIFRFIHDLAKRLLVGKSASVDLEKSMLSKLKQECGASYTNKLEGMFKDIELSKEFVISYKQQFLASKELSLDIDLNVNILTMGYWPTYTPVTVNLPTNMLDCLENCKDFYLKSHNGRNLKWQYTLDHCVLKSSFNSTLVKKEFDVSLFQCLCLLQFNDKDTLSFSELKDKLALDVSELKRTLQSLACGKVRVLKKSPPSKDVNESDIFSFNDSFSHKLYRIKINQIQMKETPEENSLTQRKVLQDRKYLIEAAIVRIMKTRKVFTHVELISELYNQLKFPAEPSDLKKQIESLIEREYMRRDKENVNKYHYIA